MKNKSLVPKYYELMNPVLKALRDLGGSGSIDEIEQRVSETIDLPEDVLGVLHDPEKSSQTELEYRLAWARTYLKRFGVLDNSSRGIWVLTPKAREIDEVDPEHVRKSVRAMVRAKKKLKKSKKDSEDENGPIDEDQSWRTQLHHILTKKMPPEAFERLSKRILRESGFVQVEVTGRSSDGGIDGKGIIRLGGLLSFHVVFQCKRYTGSISASHIRDFRGAFIGRADKGIFLTTGTFTRDAIKEATRDGAPPIDLVDGDQLIDKLKELQLGLKTQMVEQVNIDEGWFDDI